MVLFYLCGANGDQLWLTTSEGGGGCELKGKRKKSAIQVVRLLERQSSRYRLVFRRRSAVEQCPMTPVHMGKRCPNNSNALPVNGNDGGEG